MEADEKYVGVDVSASVLVVGVMPTGEIWEVDNDSEGIASLKERVEAVGPTRIVLEATGGYETEVAAELFDAGLPVCRSRWSTHGRSGSSHEPREDWPKRMPSMP